MKHTSETTADVWHVTKTLRKALVRQSSWSDKEEFLDVVYWLRQILGVVIGTIWGVIPLHGSLGLALFLLISSGVVLAFCYGYHSVDEELVGSVSDLLKEGLMASFAGFLVAWIITYSSLQFD